MKLTETKLRAIIRQLLLREAGEDDDKIQGWKPPWEGGGSGSGGHQGDRHWADNDIDSSDEFGMAEADDAEEGGGDEEE